jgi:hypothetical protein
MGLYGVFMSDVFQYQKGDRVVIYKSPDEDEQEIWSDEFYAYLNLHGEITSVYDTCEDNSDYDMYNVKFKHNGDWLEYVFYGNSLVKNDTKFAKGSTVRIVRRYTKDHGDMGWSDDMTDLIGSHGKLLDITRRPGDMNYIYKVETEYNDKKQIFWYYRYSIIDCSPDLLEVKLKKQWVLSEEGTIAYKVLKVNPDKSLKLMDRVGRQFDSTRLRIKDAPPECKGFEFIKDPPNYFG